MVGDSGLRVRGLRRRVNWYVAINDVDGFLFMPLETNACYR